MIDAVAIEPQWIALFGSLAGGMAIKGAENFMKREKKPKFSKVDAVTAEIEADKQASKPSIEWACKVWETRHVEANPLLGNGEPLPVKDMTVCDDARCANCQPTRDAIFHDRKIQAQIKSAQYEAEHRQRMIKLRMEEAERKRLATEAQLERDREARREAKRQANRQHRANKRMVMVDGVRVARPTGVPSFADVKLEFDKYGQVEIVWRWKYDDTPMMYHRLKVAGDAYIVSDGAAGTIDEWIAVYDPKTNEHLGDYRRKNGETEIRNPEPMAITAGSVTADEITLSKEMDDMREYVEDQIVMHSGTRTPILMSGDYNVSSKKNIHFHRNLSEYERYMIRKKMGKRAM